MDLFDLLDFGPHDGLDTIHGKCVEFVEAIENDPSQRFRGVTALVDRALVPLFDTHAPLSDREKSIAVFAVSVATALMVSDAAIGLGKEDSLSLALASVTLAMFRKSSSSNGEHHS